ncbi:Transcription factor CBF/NF-Y/archaeal histone domain-containing protein [Plasmodiophora brassicae]
MDDAFDLPHASIARIIRNALPKNFQVGKDARAAFIKAVSVWILYISAAANDIATSRKRKTISGDDVLAALSEIEFEEFVEPIKAIRKEIVCGPKKRAKQKREAEALQGAAAGTEAPTDSAVEEHHEKTDADDVEPHDVEESDEEDDDEEPMLPYATVNVSGPGDHDDMAVDDEGSHGNEEDEEALPDSDSPPLSST